MTKRKNRDGSTEDLVMMELKRYCSWESGRFDRTPMMVALKPSGLRFDLFSMCLDFIADNIDAVESFYRFPSLIAEMIFKRCIDLQKFKQAENLRLFVAAYPDLICESLDLSQRDLYNYTRFLSVISPCRILQLNNNLD